jgi:hypothetical protein
MIKAPSIPGSVLKIVKESLTDFATNNISGRYKDYLIIFQNNFFSIRKNIRYPINFWGINNNYFTLPKFNLSAISLED